jgi:hypothetical protein
MHNCHSYCIFELNIKPSLLFVDCGKVLGEKLCFVMQIAWNQP